MKSEMCREKLKGNREVYRQSDGRQELRSCIKITHNIYIVHTVGRTH